MHDGRKQYSRLNFRIGHIAFAILGLSFLPPATSATLIATRVWPAEVYTRVTFEAKEPIKYQFFTLANPDRLAIDLEGIDASSELNALLTRVREDDPYIKQVRVARNKPNVMRIVFDLKGEVKPSVFTLQPAGEYKHRLILDIYPAKPVDPLMALITPAKPDAIELAASGVALPTATPPSVPLAVPPTTTPDPVVTQAKTEVKAETRPRVELPTQAIASDKTTRLIIVAVDAGHGGEDPGAHGKKGTHEKDVTLAIARLLKTKIDAMPNMRAMLTRDGDYFVPLGDRVVKARKVQADLFVSIHADAFTKPDANGSSVFALSENGATSVAARWLAKRENEADLIGGVNIGVKDPYLAKTLLDLSQTATISDSLKLGKSVLSELGGINRLHKVNVEQAGFAVLKAPDIPSILVETAFISNPEEEKRLKDTDYQNKLADAVAGGIKRYFDKNPPLARTSKIALQ